MLTRSTPEAVDARPPMLGDRQRPSEAFLDPAFQTLVAAVGPYEDDGQRVAQRRKRQRDPIPRCCSCNADGVRAVEHSVEDLGGDSNLSDPGLVAVEA